MKSFKSALTLAAVTAALFAASASVQAASDTASLELRGSVAINCTIGIKPTAKATSLDIVGGEKETLVGVVTENCNAGNGYVVVLSSNNGGNLVSKSNGSKPTTYEARYDDAEGNIGEKMVAYRDTAHFDRQGKLIVSFAGNSQAIAGEYTDVINLVIAAK